METKEKKKVASKAKKKEHGEKDPKRAKTAGASSNKEGDQNSKKTDKSKAAEGTKSAPKVPKPPTVREPSQLLVINPGSRNLRIGLASDKEPLVIPQVVACCLHAPLVRPGLDQVPLAPQARAHIDMLLQKKESTLAQFEKSKKQMRTLPATNNRFFEDVATPVYDRNNRASSVLDEKDKFVWTDVSWEPQFVVGESALRIPPEAPYEIIYPMRLGGLAAEAGRSAHACADLLQKIIHYAVTDKLDIDEKDFGKYSVALVLPDSMQEIGVRELCKLILDKLKFKELFVHLESVLTCFGAGVSTACVVDIGAQKTSIACVLDGIRIPGTSVYLPYGGDDVTSALFELMKRSEHYFPLPEMNITDPQNWIEIDNIKKKLCTYALEGERHPFTSCQVRQRRSGRKTVLHRINLSDEAVIAPLVLFQPELLDPLPILLSFERRFPRCRLSSAEAFDILGDELLSNSSKTSEDKDKGKDRKRTKKRGETEKGKNGKKTSTKGKVKGRVDATSVGDAKNKPLPAKPGSSPPGSKRSSTGPAGAKKKGKEATKGKKRSKTGETSEDKTKRELTEKALLQIPARPRVQSLAFPARMAQRRMALHRAVSMALAALPDGEMRKKLATNIVLAGGGQRSRQIVDYFEGRLIECVPSPCATVEVLMSQKGVDARFLAWKGAAIVSRGEQSKDMWIRPAEWRSYDIQVLRVKAPFVWPLEKIVT